MLEAHYAEADDIDNAMKVGLWSADGARFALLDVVGPGRLAGHFRRTLFSEFREPGFGPPAPLLETPGSRRARLGRKTGKGFPRLQPSEFTGTAQLAAQFPP